MVSTVRHGVVPFDKNLGAPQRQHFQYLNLNLQVLWYRNSYDDTLTIRINDLGNYKTLLITKVVDKYVAGVRSKDGIFLFGLFVNKSDIDNPDVWLLSPGDMEYMGRQ